MLSVTSDADAILNGTVMLVAQDYQNGPEVGKWSRVSERDYALRPGHAREMRNGL